MSLSEIIRSLFGLWRLLLIDKNGVYFFDNTRNRTLRSFYIPAFVYSIVLCLMMTRAESYQGIPPLWVAFIVQGLALAISLCGTLLVTYVLVSHLEKKQDYMRYVQVNNWMALISLLLLLPAFFIQQSNEHSLGFILILLMIFAKIYGWFVVQSVFKIQWYWVLLILLSHEVIEAMTSAMAYTIIH